MERVGDIVSEVPFAVIFVEMVLAVIVSYKKIDVTISIEVLASGNKEYSVTFYSAFYTFLFEV